MRMEATLHGLLSTGKGATLPEKTQLMMHAGIGIALRETRNRQT